MKKYRVNVNGEMYEIEVELLGEVPAAPAAAPAPQAAPAPAAAPAPQAAPAPAAPVAAGEGQSVEAPMPGTILGVNVKDGDIVKKGQVLFILEAMKMENEIMAPCDGTVNSVSVMKGASVESGALLCKLA